MAERHQNPLRRFPIELQRAILTCLLSSIEIQPVPGDPIIFKQVDRHEPGYCKYQDAQGNQHTSDTFPLYQFNKADIDKLNCYRSIFSVEAREPWETHAQFNFPSTLAMFDILLGPQFPTARRKLVKKVKLVGYPVPMFGNNHPAWHTHTLADFLPRMEGLELNVLEYIDVFFPSDDDRGRDLCIRVIQFFLQAPRWKMLQVRCHDLQLTEAERDKFEKLAEEIRRDRNEAGFRYDLDVKTSRIKREENSDEGEEEERLTIIVKRGRGADTSTKGPGIADFVLADKTWHQVRSDGSYIVDNGDKDPSDYF
ncbi:hypothetical protein EDB80DRAFT_693956 [Ilyonectria destructans]|nr:hypothetical protein EDB80DRAFT_693956 [Ilyonectria destructans]